jgi:glycerophosphoryl diester phosphodiesterase
MPPLLIAHRGGKTYGFENALETSRKAIQAKCDSIEVDLRATKDGEIVLLHDETLERTTNATGKISEFTAYELKNIKLKNEEPIPFLDELLTLAKGKTLLHLEVKEPGFEEKLLQSLERHQMNDQVFIISFYTDVLNVCHRLNPKIKTGFLFLTQPRFSRIPKFCSLALPEAKLITQETLKQFKENGRQVHTWVVNQPENAKRLTALGVDGLVTDCPEKLLNSASNS